MPSRSPPVNLPRACTHHPPGCPGSLHRIPQPGLPAVRHLPAQSCHQCRKAGAGRQCPHRPQIIDTNSSLPRHPAGEFFLLHRFPQPAGHGGAAARCFRSAPAPYGRGPPGCARRRLRRHSPWACLSVGSLRSPALWYPKRTSRCSLARSFRPLRVPPISPIFRITPPARAYPCPPARTRAIRNFPRKFLLLFRRKFSFSARRIYTPFIDRLLEKDYNEGW